MVLGLEREKPPGEESKGQKSRSGVAIKSFEGGQMPLFLEDCPKEVLKKYMKVM